MNPNQPEVVVEFAEPVARSEPQPRKKLRAQPEAETAPSLGADEMTKFRASAFMLAGIPSREKVTKVPDL